MTILKRVSNDKGLLQAFKRYQKRYASAGKKANFKKLLADDLYSTVRLEGEKITKRAAQAIFR